MAATTRRDVMAAVLDGYGRTYADEAGIRLRDAPEPLYRLLVLACLLSARIRAGVAVATSKELSAAGMRSAARTAEATWQQRVDALGRGGYRRYDERTATQLGDGAHLAIRRYGGDLRRLRRQADGDVARIERLLQDFPGLGPAGAEIFVREVQAVWPEAAPFFGAKALDGARAVGLPTTPGSLLRLAGDTPPEVLAAALVRVSLDKAAPEAVHLAAHA